MTSEALWERLSAAGLVTGTAPEPGRAASPWFVRVMLGIAGWIGALFLMLFVGAAFAFIWKDAGFAFAAGTACCAAAFFLFRQFADNDFVEQFALVISLVGQALLAAGLLQHLEFDEPAFYLAMAAIEAGLALVIPNFLHRLLASGGAAIALALAVNQLRLHGLAAPLLCLGLVAIWLEPKVWASGGRIWRPVGYGLVLALLQVETFRLFGAEWLFGLASETPGWIQRHGPLVGRAVNAALLVWVALSLSLGQGAAPTSRAGLSAAAAALLFGLLSLGAPGLASAMLILLLGFGAGNRILVALGIAGLLGFIAHFYYSLHATLLEKSGLLAVTGLCLLGAHFLLRRFFPALPEPAHA